MRLKYIYVYPIKSLPGIELSSSDVQIRGLKHDRRMMLIDKNNKFITLRERSDLTGFKLAIAEEGILVTRNGSTILIDTENFDNSLEVQIWKDKTKAVLADEPINEWFSDQLEAPVRLVTMNEQSRRNPNTNQGIVSFADQWPILLFNLSSLDDLNSRLDTPVSHHFFRPNLVVEGLDAWKEEEFDQFRIGDCVFTGNGPCGRCSVINMDPESGKKVGEVLKTLKSYRGLPGKIPMGLSTIANLEGNIQVDSDVILI